MLLIHIDELISVFSGSSLDLKYGLKSSEKRIKSVGPNKPFRFLVLPLPSFLKHSAIPCAYYFSIISYNAFKAIDCRHYSHSLTHKIQIE